jgi:hypothetical protein
MFDRRLTLLLAVGLAMALVAIVGPTSADAQGCTPPAQVAPGTSGTLLNDRFGVVPALQGAPIAPGTGLPYNWGSLVPTKNLSTADYIIGDWYGSWSTTAFDSNPVPRTVRNPLGHDWWPSGDEWYDTEAIYFDNDANNFYLAFIASSPFCQTVNISGTPTDVQGVYENRSGLGTAYIVVPPSDVAIDLGLSTARDESYGDKFRYNYGLDLVHENRDVFTTYGSYSSASPRDFTLGTGMYKTYPDNQPVNQSNDNPAVGLSDWYTAMGTGAAASHGEHMNFDPQSARNNTAPMGKACDAAVNYYQVAFPGSNLENNSGTYVYEITIARSCFGTDNPATGGRVGFRWSTSCRNDGNDGEDSYLGNFAPVLKLAGAVDEGYSVGNRVWLDNGVVGGTANNGIQDGGEPGIDGVTVQLLDGNFVVATAITSNGGYYRFDKVAAGDNYKITIPASNFASTGPLYNLLSSTGNVATGTNTTDKVDNGVDNASPATNGISTPIFTVGPTTMPTNEPDLGVGPNPPTGHGPAGDTFDNLTIDLGFQPGTGFQLLDFGDLPNSYSTLLANDGPRHTLTPNLYLGACVDSEANGQPDPGALATGDNTNLLGTPTVTYGSCGPSGDEDGVARDMSYKWTPGATVQLNVTVEGEGELACWIDWNGDGNFGDGGTGDADEFINFGSSTGVVNVTIPNTHVAGTTLYTRCRLFPTEQAPGGSLTQDDYIGFAPGGEVEDYRWTFGPTAVTLSDLRATTLSTGERLMRQLRSWLQR